MLLAISKPGRFLPRFNSSLASPSLRISSIPMISTYFLLIERIIEHAMYFASHHATKMLDFQRTQMNFELSTCQTLANNLNPKSITNRIKQG